MPPYQGYDNQRILDLEERIKRLEEIVAKLLGYKKVESK